MRGSLSEILPQPIGEEAEAILVDHLKRKMRSAAGVAVRLLHAMEQRFGPEARDVVRQMSEDQTRPARPEAGPPGEDLREFCGRLDRGCVGSHRWERVTDEPDRIAYRYTRCLWAEVFRELGEPELGYVMCAGDGPAVKAYNPGLGFRRTCVLMNGDDCCDHVFTVDGRDEAGPARV